jgi:hypothetical protein
MKGWMSQLIIGIIVTVVGTLVADAVVHGAHPFGGGHIASLSRGSR